MPHYSLFNNLKTAGQCSAGLLLAIVTASLASCNGDDGATKPKVKPLIEAVYASGYVISGEEYEVISQAEGYVSEKLVQDGDEVKKGDPLYIISSDQQAARNRIARENFSLAQKNYGDNSPVLSELRALVETSETKMRFDSINFIRYTNLLAKNATTKADYDRMKLLYESTQKEYQLQRSRYEKTKNQLQLEFENARNNLVISSDEAGRYIIKSEVDGKVFMTTKDKGEMIRRSELVAIVGKDDKYYLQLNIDELDVQKVKPGQEVVVKIDAYPENTYKAQITKVFPMVDRKQQSVRADAMLKEKLPGLFSGLALEANIIIKRKENAIVIPKTSLMPGDSVLIKTDDGEKKIKVSKGIETLDEVEIIDGLDTNQFIVMTPR